MRFPRGFRTARPMLRDSFDAGFRHGLLPRGILLFVEYLITACVNILQPRAGCCSRFRVAADGFDGGRVNTSQPAPCRALFSRICIPSLAATPEQATLGALKIAVDAACTALEQLLVHLLEIQKSVVKARRAELLILPPVLRTKACIRRC